MWGHAAVCRGKSAPFCFMPVSVLLPTYRPLPPPRHPGRGGKRVGRSGGRPWTSWSSGCTQSRSSAVGCAKLRRLTRWLARVPERACLLWALLALAPGVLTPEDVLIGAFELFFATGAVEPRASIFNTPHGLGISVPALLDALQWRYPGRLVHAGVGGCIGVRVRACMCCTRLLPSCMWGWFRPAKVAGHPHAGLGSGAAAALGFGGGLCGRDRVCGVGPCGGVEQLGVYIWLLT